MPRTRSAETMYAWTTIHYSDGEERKTANPGEEVSTSSLGISDEEWEQLKEAKAVRTRKYPDMPSDFTGSPLEFVMQESRRQLEAMEDVLSEADLEASQVAEDETSTEAEDE